MSLLIKNCVLVKAHCPLRTSVLIEKGKIARVGTVSVTSADSVYDAKGALLLPGIIDSQVHFREPGNPEKETWHSGAKAAVSSGVTTVLDMPDELFPTVTSEDIERKRRYADQSFVNYGFYLEVNSDNVSLLHKMKGFVAAKLPHTSHDNLLLRAFLSRQLLVFNTEDPMLLEYYSSQYLQTPSEFRENSIPRLHHRLRPSACSEFSLAKAITLAKHTQGRLLVQSVSTKEEIALLKKAKEESLSYGFQIFAFTSPHYLLLSQDSCMDALGKVNPPLRTKQDQDALWTGLRDGVLDGISSNHTPVVWKDKQQAYLHAPSGISSIETMLPLLLEAVHCGHLTITDLQKLLSENPAKLYGLSSKGLIAPGFDADLVLVDLKLTKSICALDFHSQAKFSPFDTHVCRGWPIATFVNGELVYERIPQQKFYNPSGKEISYANSP